MQAGLKLGLQYQASDTLMLGATYTHKTELPLTGGTLISNMTSIGLGRVRCRVIAAAKQNAHLTGPSRRHPIVPWLLCPDSDHLHPMERGNVT